MGKNIPANGTSLNNEILSPVKNPVAPSFLNTLFIASNNPVYSWNPSTSSLVLITIKGLDSVVCNDLAKAEEVKLTVWSDH